MFCFPSMPVLRDGGQAGSSTRGASIDEKENYLTWVEDLAKGEYKLPWDSSIRVRDGWKYYPDGVKLGPMPKNGTTAAKPVETITI